MEGKDSYVSPVIEMSSYPQEDGISPASIATVLAVVVAAMYGAVATVGAVIVGAVAGNAAWPM